MLVDNNTGQAKPVGTVLKNPGYADALDIIAVDPNAFYNNSSISKDVVDSVSPCP